MRDTTTIKTSLEGMKIGETGIRFGVVVTRWNVDTFEVSTWGREGGLMSAAAAAAHLATK